MVMSSRLVTSPVMVRDAPIVVMGQLRVWSAGFAATDFSTPYCVCRDFRLVWLRPVARRRGRRAHCRPSLGNGTRPRRACCETQGLASLGVSRSVAGNGGGCRVVFPRGDDANEHDSRGTDRGVVVVPERRDSRP